MHPRADGSHESCLVALAWILSKGRLNPTPAVLFLHRSLYLGVAVFETFTRTTAARTGSTISTTSTISTISTSSTFSTSTFSTFSTASTFSTFL